MTTAEMAAKLRVSTETVRRMCQSGKWPHVRVGRLYRFTPEQYQEIITPPPKPAPFDRNQRRRIAEMLRRLDS